MILADQKDGGGFRGLQPRHMGAHHLIIHSDGLIQHALAGFIANAGTAVQGFGYRIAGQA